MLPWGWELCLGYMCSIVDDGSGRKPDKDAASLPDTRRPFAHACACSSICVTKLFMPVQDKFTGQSFADERNMWLGSPQATLMGKMNGNKTSVLLQLDA